MFPTFTTSIESLIVKMVETRVSPSEAVETLAVIGFGGRICGHLQMSGGVTGPYVNSITQPLSSLLIKFSGVPWILLQYSSPLK